MFSKNRNEISFKTSESAMAFGAKYRCEDILSCISALDEVIAEFDDPSLPYINEEEGAVGIQGASALSPSFSMSAEMQMPIGHRLYSAGDNKQLVSRNDRTNHNFPSQSNLKSVKQQHEKATQEEPLSNALTSHLTQIPVVSSKSTAYFQPIFTEKSISPSCSTSSSFSGKLSRGSAASRTSSEKANGNGSTNSSTSSSSNVKSASIGSGTYSKGTNYEIILPRIPSDKSSRNNYIAKEPIYCSIGKSRPQLSIGVFTSSEMSGVKKSKGQLYPQEPEPDYNEENDGNFYHYNASSETEGLSAAGSGKLSKSSSSNFSTGPRNTLTEQWNFPSEKNLPRSLRKTRKTCLLDEEEGEKSEGKVNNESCCSDLNDYNGEGASPNGCVVVSHSSSSASSSSSAGIKSCDEINQNNRKTSPPTDDSRKIYEDIVVISSSSNNSKSKNHHRNRQNNSSHTNTNKVQEEEGGDKSPSSSCSLSLDTSSLGDQPVPKPRIRQQIPKADESSQMHVKYPPGKIPKPNPKPGSNSRIELEGASSPLSPVQCEISRNEDESGLKEAIKMSKTASKSSSPSSPIDQNEEIDRETSNAMLLSSSSNNGVKNLNNGMSPNNPNNGNGSMMRMMMMTKSSAKNNSTGSASSISRSSSSSSGGDSNYYRKDNLSSSSGIVVTTSSSTTTESPTHSVSNNNLNNNITIINTDKVKGGRSVIEVKGQPEQKRSHNHPVVVGNKLTCQQHQQSGPNNKPTVVPGSGVLDVDDGYLSMINRNEAPLLWPEEFIENETFSPDELKRLSVHLPEEEDTSPSDSDSCSEEKEIELEIVDYDREPSRRHPHHNRSLKSTSAPINRRNMLSAGRDKNDYFSDDSLEGGESEEQGLKCHKSSKNTRGNSVSPYLHSSVTYSSASDYNNTSVDYNSGSSPPQHGGKRNTASFISASPHNQQSYQKITINNAIIQQTKSQMSRIPKKVSGGNGKKSNLQSDSQEAEVVKRKPCSFFVPLTDGPSPSEVNLTTGVKSSSLPKGSKVAISPAKMMTESCPIKDHKIIASDSGTQKENAELVSNNNPSKRSSNATFNNNNHNSNDNNSSKNTKQLTSHLPQLRHTKSINTGGPRTISYNVNNNANKRKSTSDLVTVVALNQHNTENPETNKTEEISKGVLQPAEANVVVTSSFNRTTFLIPSPCSRTVDEERQGRQKRQMDDETDNDEDDFSLDFDHVSVTDQDSMQPLSIDNVHDFVSEIMDTAIRHELTRAQTFTNPTDKTIINTTSLIIHDDDSNSSSKDLKTNGENVENKLLPSSPELLSSNPELLVLQVSEQQKNTQKSKKSGREDEKNGHKGSLELSERNLKEEILCDDNNCKSFGGKGEVDRDQELKKEENDDLDDERGEEGDLRNKKEFTVAEQLDAVVTNFLSYNESFLGKSEEEEDEQVEPPTDNQSHVLEEQTSSRKGDQEKAFQVSEGLSKGRQESQEDKSSEPMVTMLSLTTDDNPTESVIPLMSSTPIYNTNSNNGTLRDSSLVGENKILDESEEEELPPEFIPPPPQLLSPVESSQIIPPVGSQKNFLQGSRNQRFVNSNLPYHHNSNFRDGKAALDLLAQRISNSKKCHSPDDQLQVSQFIHDKRNIWALYDRPFDEDLLTVNSAGRGYSSRSQENLVDAMTKERFQKSFSARGQSSTLPLNCRPPTSQRRSSTFRNMFNKFRRNKQPGAVIKEIPEYRDDEVQSITSRETGPSEQGKKRGFFSRLFRRSRKH